MKVSKALWWGLLSGAITPTSALPRDPTDDQVGAEIDAGTFKDPSVQVRPRFRYWVPDASVDLDTLVDDVKEIGRIGASGFELLGFYLYGGPPAGFGTLAPVDWSKYGWGTVAWRNLFKRFAQATKDNGLIMDFAMGPNQGQGVPAPYDDDGKSWDLHVVQKTLTANQTIDGVLEGWGKGPLEAVILAANPIATNNKKLVTASSLQDLTSQVSKDGKLTLTTPSSADNNYILFTAYLIHSDWQAQDSPLLMDGPQTPPETWVQNGSWSTDHFSRRGAQMAIKFWEEHMLVDGVRELVKEVGNYAWEDSVELRQKYRWTKGYLDRFQKEHKYDLRRYLPVIFGFKTDQWDQGERYTMDYRTTLANGYGEFLEEFTTWANEKVGIQYSCQVSYGMSLDELANVAKVNAPEDESLEYANEIDRYFQYAGPAHLAGKRVISNELGAEIYLAFQQRLPSLMDQFRRAMAGGVNQVVIHGSPFSGNYPNTTWPGYTTFGYQFADSHSRHQPAWDDYHIYMDAMGRHQYILQSGVPKRDVVFWQKRFWYPGNTSYPLLDLHNQGYTYEYLSPDNFVLPAAKVENGIFAPDAQGFKSLVVRIYDFLTVPGVKKLAEYAKAGLPIIFDGGVSTRLWAHHKCEAEYVKKAMHEIAKLDNVHVIEGERDLADEFMKLGIEPLTKISTNGSWYTVWREDAKVGAEYVYVFNEQGKASSGTIEFLSTKTPYFFDVWTGEQAPVPVYEQDDKRTKIPFTLQGNQSAIVAFLDKPLGDVPTTHAVSVSKDVLSITAVKKSLSVKAGSKGSSLEVKTSDGKTHSIGTTAAEPFDLKSWDLRVEHWAPPADLMDVQTTAAKSNSTHKLDALVSWQKIEGLQDVSGRGHYSTRFSWPPASAKADADADGAFIDFGRVFHTLRVSVNGREVPPLDPSQARADIGPYLKEGENVVEAVIATTLVNTLRPIWSQLRSSATTPLKQVPAAQDYGLMGPITVTPYKETVI